MQLVLKARPTTQGLGQIYIYWLSEHWFINNQVKKAVKLVYKMFHPA